MTGGRPDGHHGRVRDVPVGLTSRVGAAVVAGAALGVAVLGMAVWWAGPRDGGDWAWSLAVALVYGPAGVAVLTTAPRLGRVFLAMAASSGVALLAGEQAAAVASGRSDLAGGLSVWLSGWTWVPAYVLLAAVVPHLLPDGEPPSGRSRWGYRAGLAAAGVSTAAWLLAPYDELDEASSAALALGASNPVGVPGAAVGIALGLGLTLVGGVAGLASLALRWRRAADRHGLTWVLVGAAATAALLAAGLAVPGGSGALLALAVVPLPVSVVLGAASGAARLDRRLRLSEARLAVAREEERRRLRHDLHDSLGPALAGVALQLETLGEDIGSHPARAAETAERLTDRVREAVEEVRRLVDGLGPDGSLGLAEALVTTVGGFDAPSLRSSLHMDPDDVRDLPAAVEVAAVRVVGEALANAARHAAADRCSVTVRRQPDRLLVRVRDNGIGISASRAPGPRGPPRQRGGPALDAGGGRPHRRVVRGRRRAGRRHRGAAGAAAGAPMRVLLVDDHPVFREGMAAVLSRVDGVELVGEAGDGHDAVRLAAELLPDVVVMDLHLPGLNGVEATRALTASLPGVAVLVLTMLEGDASVAAAVRAGARGYLVKGTGRDEIVAALTAVAGGASYFGRGVPLGGLAATTAGRPAVGHPAFPGLTERELEVLALVARGLSNAAIAGRLHLSDKTVRNYVSTVLSKLEVRDRAAAVALARDRGLTG